MTNFSLQINQQDNINIYIGSLYVDGEGNKNSQLFKSHYPNTSHWIVRSAPINTNMHFVLVKQPTTQFLSPCCFDASIANTFTMHKAHMHLQSNHSASTTSSFFVTIVATATPSKILAYTQIFKPSLVFRFNFASTRAHFMSSLRVFSCLSLVWPIVIFWHAWLFYHTYIPFLVSLKVFFCVFDFS